MRSIVFLCLVLFSGASWPQTSDKLVSPSATVPVITCLEVEGLVKVLKKVKNPKQFWTNDIDYNSLNKNGCSYYHLPLDTRFYRLGFINTAQYEPFRHKGKESAKPKWKVKKTVDGFIFSIYKVVFTSGVRLYMARSMYSTERWKLQSGERCGFGRTGSCVLPLSCEYYVRSWPLQPYQRQEIGFVRNCTN